MTISDLKPLEGELVALELKDGTVLKALLVHSSDEDNDIIVELVESNRRKLFIDPNNALVSICVDDILTATIGERPAAS